MLNRTDRLREQQAMRRRIRVELALRRLATQDVQPKPDTEAKAR